MAVRIGVQPAGFQPGCHTLTQSGSLNPRSCHVFTCCTVSEKSESTVFEREEPELRRRPGSHALGHRPAHGAGLRSSLVIARHGDSFSSCPFLPRRKPLG